MKEITKDVSAWRVVAGVAVGVGAVAAVPFTGGGSLLGGATLAGALTGAATSATVAGIVGGIAGGVISKKEKKNADETLKNKYEEGYKAGEEDTKSRFNNLMKIQRNRDELLLLVTKIGTYVAKCDGDFSELEKLELEHFLGLVNNSFITPSIIKERISEIILQDFTFSDLLDAMFDFLSDKTPEDENECIVFINSIIDKMINADGVVYPAEEEFQKKWNEVFN